MDNKKLNRVRFSKGIFLLIFVCSVIAGCSEDSGQSGSGTENHKVVEVNCRLQIEPLKGESATRAERVAINGEWTENEEAAINNLTVIQFDGDGTDNEAQSVIVRTFNNPKLENLIIGLMQPPDNREQFLYFICNVGDVLSGFTGTLGELKAKPLTIDPAISASDGIVMTGTCRSTLVAGTPIKVNLMRRLVKIRFTYSSTGLPEGDSFEPVWLQLLSVPKAMELEPASETTNASVGFSDPDPVLNHIDQGYVWYIAENKRGKGTNTSGSVGDKDGNHAPDAYCTCILLEGKYYQASDSKTYKVYYRFYPGVDNVNDFNLESNHVYNVVLNLTGIGSSDGRVESSEMVGSLPGANCYMTAPGSTLTFNPYAAPGENISATGWDYATRMGTKDASHIDHVGLVWQTEKGLIKNVYNLVSSGEIRLSTDNNSGNALIAAYDSDNNILWSWHIWITDYSPVNVDDNMTDDSAAKVTGGHVYKLKGTIWMDRGAGATTAERGYLTTLSMSYQWGRKDPFVQPSGWASAYTSAAQFDPVYDADGEYFYTTGQQFDASYLESGGYIFNKVMNNPSTFFTTGGSPGSGNVEYLWYSLQHIVSDLWSPSKKTFFDPCPAGWHVPSKAVMDQSSGYIAVSYNSGTPANNGLYCNVAGLNDLYWPYAGYRYVTTGQPQGTGHQGIYWTSDSSNGNSANVYGGSQSKRDNNARRHADGQSVRCVKIPDSN